MSGKIYVISDLHLGHENMAIHRGFLNAEDHYDNIKHQLNIANKKIEELKKEVERLSIKFHDPELNKPNPNKDDISFSEDVFTITENGLLGVAFYDFDKREWRFHTDQLDDSSFKWFYLPNQH